jgi:hypothetical protein
MATTVTDLHVVGSLHPSFEIPHGGDMGDILNEGETLFRAFRLLLPQGAITRVSKFFCFIMFQ